jgi:hypothetical protein
MSKLLLLIFFVFQFSNTSIAQSSFSLKYFGLTIHPLGDKLAHIQPYRLDKNAYLVGNIGALAKYEKFIWEDILAINVAQALFSDCSAGLASISSLGFQLLIFEKKKHHIYIDIGSTLFIREDWNRFPEYEGRGGYNQYYYANKSWEYGFYPISTLLEYDFDISPKTCASFNVAPFPVIAIGAGFKYWFSKEFKIKEKMLVPKSK